MNAVHVFEAVMLAWSSIIMVMVVLSFWKDFDMRIPATLAGTQAVVLSVVFVLALLRII